MLDFRDFPVIVMLVEIIKFTLSHLIFTKLVSGAFLVFSHYKEGPPAQFVTCLSLYEILVASDLLSFRSVIFCL